jgi:regulator of protease activity HflC (stomatin/prohibitin superfamily)
MTNRSDGIPALPRKAISLMIGIVLLFVLLVASTKVFENLDAKDIMVIQSPLKGNLKWSLDQGVKYQGFGKVTKYLKRAQFWFSIKKDQGVKGDESIKIRFNDNSHASISGSIAWEMPTDVTNLIALHRKYGSQQAIEQQLVRTVIEKAVYMTGPTMSSTESASERRNELLNIIEDQIQRGAYKTETVEEKKPDPITGIIKSFKVAKIMLDKNGLPLRVDASPLAEFGIKTFNLSINEVQYDKDVEAQIQQQQRALMQVQIAVARAREAEQDAITIAKKGEAEAAKAKWDQEVIKARVVTEAEQRKRVAELDMQAAEMKKKELILLGEGEGTRKRLVMEADGALTQKGQWYLEANKYWADAAAKYQGNWVPLFQSGGTPGQAGSGVQQFMDLFSMKLAKDLGLDINLRKGPVQPQK